MSGNRCPACAALNPHDAPRCSLCGEPLAGAALEQPPRDTGIRYALAGLDPVPPQRLALRGAGMGALTGAALFLMVALAALVPLLGALVLFLVPALPLPGLLSLISFVPTGALLGALVGALAPLPRGLAAGVALSAVLFAALRVWELMLLWAGVAWYDTTYPIISGITRAAAAAAVGIAFAYLVSLVVRASLADAGGPPPQ